MFRSIKRKKPFDFKAAQLPGENHQLLDLLQWSRKEKECRNSCRVALREFNNWKKSQVRSNDNGLKLYSLMETMLRRRQAHEAFIIYRIIRKERERLFREYLEKLPNRTTMLHAV